MEREGFFTRKETESITRPDGKTLSCSACGLYKDCASPRMAPFGNFKKKILNIGEAPGETEDKEGKPWQGKVGRMLQQTYKKLGIDLFEDCLNINAARCRPMDKKGNNRAPSNFEVECCRKTVIQTIEEYKPRLIIPLGNMAVYSLLGHRWKKDLGGITKWRGWTIPDQDFNAWICPTFHPSFIERSFSNQFGGRVFISVEETIWIQDLKQAFNLIGTYSYQNKEYDNISFPIYKEPTIEIIEDLSILNKINSEIAIDYETTGLKPHAEGHKIVCCAIATNENHAYVFMMPPTRRERQPLIDLLANPEIGKIAQNMKFEEAWSVVRLKQPVINWIWDSMLMSHVLDNRPGVTGLKFQVYVHFGIIDYASEIGPYLQCDDNRNANAINRLKLLLFKPGGREKLMKYCGLDAVYEYRLTQKQRSDLLPF
jgi:DNA polymerase